MTEELSVSLRENENSDLKTKCEIESDEIVHSTELNEETIMKSPSHHHSPKISSKKELREKSKAQKHRDLFWDQFRLSISKIQYELDGLFPNKSSVEKCDNMKTFDITTAAQRQSIMLKLNDSKKELRRISSSSSQNFLDSDIRLMTQILNPIQERIEQIVSEINPPEKFTFKRYHEFSLHVKKLKETDNGNDVIVNQETQDYSEKIRKNDSASPDKTAIDNLNVFYIENKRDETIIFQPPVLSEPFDENTKEKQSSLHIQNLKNCIIILPPQNYQKHEGCTRGHHKTIYISNCSSCTIISYETTSGPIFVHSCYSTKFVTCSKQLRIHDSTDLEFHIFCASGPIIENCSKIMFHGDYIQELRVHDNNFIESNNGEKGKTEKHQVFVNQIYRDMESCELLSISSQSSTDICYREQNEYINVKDFNWHKMLQKSPNFDVIQLNPLTNEELDNVDTSVNMTDSASAKSSSQSKTLTAMNDHVSEILQESDSDEDEL